MAAQQLRQQLEELDNSKTAKETAAAESVKAAEPVGPVDEEDLLAAQENNANWLMYGRTYNSQRYSGLDQINKDNVSNLLPVWTFQTGVLDGFGWKALAQKKLSHDQVGRRMPRFIAQESIQGLVAIVGAPGHDQKSAQA